MNADNNYASNSNMHTAT